MCGLIVYVDIVHQGRECMVTWKEDSWSHSLHKGREEKGGGEEKGSARIQLTLSFNILYSILVFVCSHVCAYVCGGIAREQIMCM